MSNSILNFTGSPNTNQYGPLSVASHGFTASTPTATATQDFNPSTWDSLFGYTDQNTGVQHAGTFLPTAQAVGGLAQSWLGFQNLGLAKDQFNFQKGAFNDQFNQQVSQYNTSINDRANSRGYLTDAQKASYVNQNTLEGRG